MDVYLNPWPHIAPAGQAHDLQVVNALVKERKSKCMKSLTVMLAVPLSMSPAKGEDLPEESGYQEEENFPEDLEFPEDAEFQEEPVVRLEAAKAAAPDYTISKSGYSGYEVLETGFENYGTIGVFIPRSMMGQELEYGADGGLEWIPESITYYATDTKTSESTTENVLAALIYRGAVDAGVTRINGSAYILLKQPP